MWEITYSVDGLIKTINIQAGDYNQAQTYFLNMFQGGRYEIINIKRI